jgi:hypothetical protein
MARDRQKKHLSVLRSRKAQPDPYTSRILKTPSKRELEASLRHAVRNHDHDALEDYDEEQLRPPTNAVKPLDPDAEGLAYDNKSIEDWYDWSDADDDYGDGSMDD